MLLNLFERLPFAEKNTTTPPHGVNPDRGGKEMIYPLRILGAGPNPKGIPETLQIGNNEKDQHYPIDNREWLEDHGDVRCKPVITCQTRIGDFQKHAVNHEVTIFHRVIGHGQKHYAKNYQ